MGVMLDLLDDGDEEEDVLVDENEDDLELRREGGEETFCIWDGGVDSDDVGVLDVGDGDRSCDKRRRT